MTSGYPCSHGVHHVWCIDCDQDWHALKRERDELLAMAKMLSLQPEDKLIASTGALCVLCGRGPYAFPELKHADTCPWAVARKIAGKEACKHEVDPSKSVMDSWPAMYLCLKCGESFQKPEDVKAFRAAIAPTPHTEIDIGIDLALAVKKWRELKSNEREHVLAEIRQADERDVSDGGWWAALVLLRAAIPGPGKP